MAIPYHSQEQSIRLRWPIPFCPTAFPVPFSDAICAPTPHIPAFSLAPFHAVFVQDASWFPIGRRSRGAPVVSDVHIGHDTLHHIPMCILCDNSYQAEWYVASVVLRARACARWFTRDERWSLTNSNSYITTLGSRDGQRFPFGCVPSLCVLILGHKHRPSLVPVLPPHRHLFGPRDGCRGLLSTRCGDVPNPLTRMDTTPSGAPGSFHTQ